MTARSDGPTGASGRIASLDVLRGFALLGILAMNIQVFSMPAAAYINPTAFGDLSGLNLAVWGISQLLANQKFITLFSLLFGAGICLFADRIEARGDRAAGPHYRRMGWLLVFGLAHAYLLWYGDILVSYAVCGCLLYRARRWKPRTLIAAGLGVFSVASVLFLLLGAALSAPSLPEDAAREIERDWAPGAAALDAEIAAYRGGWTEQQPLRAEQALGVHLFLLPFLLVWSCGGAMLLGMALYRLGVLSAAKDDRFYRKLTASGFLVGAPLVALGIWWNFSGGWSWERSMFFGPQWNYWGSLVLALGYLGLVMLAVRRRFLPGFQTRLAAVGRIAFTNYIFQTVVCTSIFYGHGLGLFGGVERYPQLAIAAAVVAFQLWLSPIWLRRFAYGPLEWLWRTLTYGRAPPIRRSR